MQTPELRHGRLAHGSSMFRHLLPLVPGAHEHVKELLLLGCERQVDPKAQGLDWQGSKSLSQVLPVNPDLHAHVKELLVLLGCE